MAIKQDWAGINLNSIDYRVLLNDDINIIQIGAHDGVVGEEYGLQELLKDTKNFKLFLIEPIKKYFDNLKNVYSKHGDKISYFNFAITNKDGKTKMIDRGGMSHISDIGSIEVECKKWSTFLTENNIEKIDLLLLDCEGYEFEILKNINFDKIRPKIIRYEYFHIENKEECDNFLKSKKYDIQLCYHDHTYNKVAISNI